MWPGRSVERKGSAMSFFFPPPPQLLWTTTVGRSLKPKPHSMCHLLSSLFVIKDHKLIVRPKVDNHSLCKEIDRKVNQDNRWRLDWRVATTTTKGSASSPDNNRWENIADPIIKVTGMKQPKSIKAVLKLARICKGTRGR